MEEFFVNFGFRRSFVRSSKSVAVLSEPTKLSLFVQFDKLMFILFLLRRRKNFHRFSPFLRFARFCVFQCEQTELFSFLRFILFLNKHYFVSNLIWGPAF